VSLSLSCVCVCVCVCACVRACVHAFADIYVCGWLLRVMDAGVEASFAESFEFIVPASGLASAEVSATARVCPIDYCFLSDRLSDVFIHLFVRSFAPSPVCVACRSPWR
jgi:hypothetical protein